jgi:hypothetical protein
VNAARAPEVDGPRVARALRTYTRATAASFALLYVGAFGFALFLVWWHAKEYPPFPTAHAWLGIRLIPVLLLVPRLLAGARGLRASRVAFVAHLAWAGLLTASFVGALAPAWLPFSLLAHAAWGAGAVRDVLGLRFVAALTDRPAIGRLAIVWAVHELAWGLLGRAVFVEATTSALWPVLTTLVLGVVTLRALRSAHAQLLANEASE